MGLGMASERIQNALRVHGDVSNAELRALGVRPDDVLDLSVNVNPLGPHPDVALAVRTAELARYPDREGARARQAIAHACDEDPARVVLGHGSVELLWALVRALVGLNGSSSESLLIVGPTFSEPERAARAQGIAVVRVDMREDDDFALHPASIEAAIARHAPSAVYLCHPNNPTGRVLPADALQALFEAHGSTHFVLDQAFLSLSHQHAQANLRFGDNVTRVRSLTKDHALAGLRVGYALAKPALVQRIEAQRPPWLISSLAQEAIVAALAHPEHVTDSRTRWLAAQHDLHQALTALGLRVVPSEAPYLLVHLGPEITADALRERLLHEHGVLVRSASSFGLPHHVRIAACFETERARLLAALAAVLTFERGSNR
jgi:histidinol-phosphate aminotransferase